MVGRMRVGVPPVALTLRHCKYSGVADRSSFHRRSRRQGRRAFPRRAFMRRRGVFS